MRIMAKKPSRIALHLRLTRPLATAYMLGLLSSTGPRLIHILFLLGKGKLGIRAAWMQFTTILRQAVAPHRFPTFCGVLIGGSTLLQIPIKNLILFLRYSLRSPSRSIDFIPTRQAAQFIAAIVSAAVSFHLLNTAPTKPSMPSGTELAQPSTHLEPCEPGPFDEPPEIYSQDIDHTTLQARSLSRTDLAGRTMDLTLFSIIRALDIIVSRAWRATPFSKDSSRLRFISWSSPSLLFCFSAATIMHAWFYSPSRLPQTFDRWISAAAELDHRLLLALRHARYGTWIYGKDTGMAPLLGSMCRDYGFSEDWGNPALTIPVPCELVHMGRGGKSCEKHAFLRFCRSWAFAAKMYAPLQFLVLVRSARARSRHGNRSGLTWDALLRATIDMARSSAFLGAFIAFFYYGVCLSRTRLGPKVFSSSTISPQMWDSGLCVLSGCLLCGPSILIEQSRKRLEILFFVLPRAAATWFPRRYLPEHRWKEHLAFTISAAVVLTTAQGHPKRVRGVLGNVLHGVLKIE
ncbi:uncharacterized protein BDR25DRAFT_31933 [Lindgomyces ingoldianus]|uniref:Uncharacterized protein n=1 Tax=Lindgomyces ingoldianus TaxID=673940 RepID=A0ACB6QUT8_9PLEO|nr:uncharacterized protein BDR25DRAFT_31933 [Lindgomyces ingoldianus]KAF2470701.1 hypothetical protein BDR25DRAFT_31933 [Lindgomyces ingoldianus]